MKLRTRKASWFVSGMVLVALMSVGVELVVAQPKTETSRPAVGSSEPAFELLGEHYLVNVNNIAYTNDDGMVFDIYFACSSARAPDPLRFTDEKDIKRARAYFSDDKRHGKHFVQLNRYCINTRHIIYIESKRDSIVVNFNARIADSFVYLTLSGADAETFKKKMQAF